MKQLIFNRVHSNPVKLFIKEKVLSQLFCKKIIDYTTEINSGFKRIKNNTPLHWDIKCDTCRIPFDNSLNKELSSSLNQLWEDAIKFYMFDIDYIEHYEIKRYGTNDYVTEHQDAFYGTISEVERKLTMLCQLNQDYEGGDLLIAKKPMTKSIGSVIILPSFYLHEVKPVISGNRYSLNCWGWGKFWH